MIPAVYAIKLPPFFRRDPSAGRASTVGHRSPPPPRTWTAWRCTTRSGNSTTDIQRTESIKRWKIDLHFLWQPSCLSMIEVGGIDMNVPVSRDPVLHQKIRPKNGKNLASNRFVEHQGFFWRSEIPQCRSEIAFLKKKSGHLYFRKHFCTRKGRDPEQNRLLKPDPQLKPKRIRNRGRREEKR